MSDRARRAFGALLVGFGAVMAVANSRNAAFPTHYTQDWVLFGGGTGFPDDFGRSVFAGSIGLGLVIAVAGVIIVVARGRIAAGLGLAMLLFGALIVVAYQSSGNVLAARPAGGAVLVAAGIALLASRTRRGVTQAQ